MSKGMNGGNQGRVMGRARVYWAVQPVVGSLDLIACVIGS